MAIGFGGILHFGHVVIWHTIIIPVILTGYLLSRLLIAIVFSLCMPIAMPRFLSSFTLDVGIALRISHSHWHPALRPHSAFFAMRLYSRLGSYFA